MTGLSLNRILINAAAVEMSREICEALCKILLFQFKYVLSFHDVSKTCRICTKYSSFYQGIILWQTKFKIKHSSVTLKITYIEFCMTDGSTIHTRIYGGAESFLFVCFLITNQAYIVPMRSWNQIKNWIISHFWFSSSSSNWTPMLD